MESGAETLTPFALTLGEHALDLETLDACLGRPLALTLAPSALARVGQTRVRIEELLETGQAVYGVNTGFGELRRKRIAGDQLDQLQENLILSHAVGVGPPAPPDIVRWMLLFKVHMLLKGLSGVRVETIERLTAWLNNDVLPVVPIRGSLGASGDLAPLAHLALPLIGRGEMITSTGTRPAAQVLAEAGEKPLRLGAKEGLALVNGTQFMSAYSANIAVRANRLANLADLIVCMSLEGCRGSVAPADERLHLARPHPGAQTVAANIRRHMRDSEILASHADCDRVQDPYSLRCAPQVHGAFRDALTHFTETMIREVNSVTDNPILFSGSRDGTIEAVSGGNFHGAPLALVLEYLGVALTDFANISERRIYLLLSGEDDLPKLLMKDTGLNSGFMLLQYTAAALLNECKVLANPAATDSITTSLGQEDHVSMGATSALKCYEILDRVETVLAIEMMCAAQAIDYRAPMQPGIGPRAAQQAIRRHITHAEQDREFGKDIAMALELLREDETLREIAKPPAGNGPS